MEPQRRRWLARMLILLAGFCLVLGLTLPILRMDRLYVFTQTPSIIDLIGGLWSEGEWMLAVLIALFSVIFPVLKLVVLIVRESGRMLSAGMLGRALPHLSKWSMIDVMLVAIAIFAAKSSGLAAAVAQPGLWFYAASAVIVGLLLPVTTSAGKE
ncbi:paraquat-inducible protein A [Rhizobium sp. SL86]|uniref:paraquat-inducible protein A n=1 Tax=Rhizobium sp. SL86 TaxID=2995148 RepID=UPI0022754391|nr:paraquat-inducible protein A [Rhizobium sp. SL86]MCY1667972.1 paraquat-inducible protein A [Rhizobium sp. SL86]